MGSRRFRRLLLRGKVNIFHSYDGVKVSMLGKYKIIYADPPWAYNDRKAIRKDGKMAKRGYGSANLYDVMTVDEICNLHIDPDLEECATAYLRPDICYHVSQIAGPNSALFLWTTWPHISSALRVMEAWGFTYKTCAFDWMKCNLKNDKPWRGIGYYAKSNTEPCLLGIRGKMKPVDNHVSMAVYEPHPRKDGKIIHSRKPATVRDRIVQLFGDVPRIELFARERIPGWDAWGNELEVNTGLSSNGRTADFESADSGSNPDGPIKLMDEVSQ